MTGSGCRPSVFLWVQCAKHGAWTRLGNMSSVEAKHGYIRKVEELFPEWRGIRAVCAYPTILPLPFACLLHLQPICPPRILSKNFPPHVSLSFARRPLLTRSLQLDACCHRNRTHQIHVIARAIADTLAHTNARACACDRTRQAPGDLGEWGPYGPPPQLQAEERLASGLGHSGQMSAGPFSPSPTGDKTVEEESESVSEATQRNRDYLRKLRAGEVEYTEGEPESTTLDRKEDIDHLLADDKPRIDQARDQEARSVRTAGADEDSSSREWPPAAERQPTHERPRSNSSCSVLPLAAERPLQVPPHVADVHTDSRGGVDGEIPVRSPTSPSLVAPSMQSAPW